MLTQPTDTAHGTPAPPCCPLCAALGTRLFQRHGYWICACAQCGHRYAALTVNEEHVSRCYDDAYFRGGGGGYPDYTLEADLLREQGRRYCRLVREYCPPGRLLDVGAAAGFVLEGFLEGGWSAVAIEPNQAMAEQVRTRLGCAARACPLEAYHPTEQFDLVLMIQVMPHFTDLLSALEAAALATRPGGFWLIETWNRASRAARLFGRYWHEYNPPTVLHWFTPASLEQLGARFGFRRVCSARARKRIAFAHARSLLRHHLEGTPMALATALLDVLPDRFSLPYPGDDAFWMLLQLESDRT